MTKQMEKEFEAAEKAMGIKKLLNACDVTKINLVITDASGE